MGCGVVYIPILFSIYDPSQVKVMHQECQISGNGQ